MVVAQFLVFPTAVSHPTFLLSYLFPKFSLLLSTVDRASDEVLKKVLILLFLCMCYIFIEGKLSSSSSSRYDSKLRVKSSPILLHSAHSNCLLISPELSNTSLLHKETLEVVFLLVLSRHEMKNLPQ